MELDRQKLQSSESNDWTPTSVSSTKSSRSQRSLINKPPNSPTDSMMSPVSKRLLLRKSRSTDDTESQKVNKISVNLSDITPIPFPAPQLDFIFASSSKFRKLIVDRLGWGYTQMNPDINEKAIRCEDPIDLPIRIAEAKAQAIVEQLQRNQVNSEKLILTADQIVLFEQQIREKPESEQQAREFLESYSEKSVSTVSAVVITHYPSGIQSSGFDIASINWNLLPSDVIAKVVAEREIFSCAGGFRIEDPLLQPFIHSIDGSFDSVLGLPVKLVINLVTEVLSYLDSGARPAGDDRDDF